MVEKEKKVTKRQGRRAAKKAIWTAAKALLAELDARPSSLENEEFVAHFHLDCQSARTFTMYGKPGLMTCIQPIYKYARARV